MTLKQGIELAGRPAKPPAVPRAVGIWLLGVAVLVGAMIVLGGATRLTESGLSIVRWELVTGVLPPLDEAGWQRAFDAYRQFPEYRKVNRGMSLGEFKTVYWFEYAHRLLGRIVGAAFLLPFLWFLWRRRIPRAMAWQFGGLFLLGGLQGAVGWWMVASGLVDRPEVSQYRLAVHLGLAFALLGLLLRAGWRVLRPVEAGDGWAYAVLALVFLQVLSGALVAGLDAGLHYNTFPTMNGLWLPSELWQLEPAWRNLFENPTTVQFVHRMGALAVTLAVLAQVFRRRGDGGAWLLLAALVLQAGLGVATLLHQVPVTLGVLHQAGAIVLFVAVLRLAERRSTPG